MATNADSMYPTASGLIRAEYPVTTPRASSRRTRDWTADTDNPAVAASCASVARPSATSSRARMRSISSSGSLMAALYPSVLIGEARRITEEGGAEPARAEKFVAEPRRFRRADGVVSDLTLRVRFGEVESRGVALTAKGRRSFDAAMATPDPARVWGDHFPATHEHMASAGLAYHRGGDPSKPVVYEDFLPASAAGIFRSNLDTDAQIADGEEDRDRDCHVDWMAGQIGHHIHDPYELYEKVASS